MIRSQIYSDVLVLMCCLQICVICRKKGHLIPTCPELNEKIVPNPNHNTEQKKESGKKGSARPQPPQDGKALPVVILLNCVLCSCFRRCV